MTEQNDQSRPQPRPMPRPVLCPYCGTTSHDSAKCSGCGGLFDPLSRQATQNAMGPWFIRDQTNPFRPGCSFETLRGLIARAKIAPDTVLRGPSTRQFWELARRTPGIANLLGLCHNCQESVDPAEFSCRACGAAFNTEHDRQHLGVGTVRLLPGQASPERIAAASLPARAVDRTAGAPTSAPRPEASPPTPVPTGPSRSRSRWPKVTLGVVGVGVVVGLGALAVFWQLSEQGISPDSLVFEEPRIIPAPGPARILAPEPDAESLVVDSALQEQKPDPEVSSAEKLVSAESQPDTLNDVWGRLERLRGLR